MQPKDPILRDKLRSPFKAIQGNFDHLMGMVRALGKAHNALDDVVEEVVDRLNEDEQTIGEHAHTGDDDSVAISHSDLSGVTANQHHNQAHTVLSTDHSDTLSSDTPASGDVLTWDGSQWIADPADPETAGRSPKRGSRPPAMYDDGHEHDVVWMPPKGDKGDTGATGAAGADGGVGSAGRDGLMVPWPGDDGAEGFFMPGGAAAAGVSGDPTMGGDIDGTASDARVYGVTKAITVSIGADTNDWAPTGLATANFILVDNSDTPTPHTISGIDATGVTDGRWLWVYHNGSGSALDIFLSIDDPASLAANRIAWQGGGDLKLFPGQGVLLRYDSSLTRWIPQLAGGPVNGLGLAANSHGGGSEDLHGLRYIQWGAGLVDVDAVSTEGVLNLGVSLGIFDDGGAVATGQDVYKLDFGTGLAVTDNADGSVTVDASGGAGAGGVPGFPGADPEDPFFFPPERRDVATQTKSLWLPVGEGAVDSTGGAALTQQGTLPDRREFHLWADGVADNGSMFNFAVPSDWNSGALTAKVYAEATTGFNGTTDAWVVKVDYLYAGDNDNSSGAGTSASTTITPAADTALDLVISPALDIGTPTAAGQYLRLYIERRGSVAADTYTGNLRVFGILVEYTATTPPGPRGATGPAGAAGASTLDALSDVAITGVAKDDHLVYDGSNFVNTPVLRGLYGDGSDGALTFSVGGPTTGGATRVGTTYTMTRDIFATSLTVDSTIIIETSNFRIFVSGTLTNNGTIQSNGGDASGATAGAATGRGTYCGPSSAGGAGLANGTTTVAGNAGAAGGGSGTHYSPGKTLGSGSAGGAGGNSNGGAGGSNASGATGFPTPRDAIYLMSTWHQSSSTATGSGSLIIPFGATGGGGGGRTTGGTATVSGAGGGGAGIVFIAARIIVNSSGTIQANGGAGSAATGGTCSTGGGGGGGGGTVILIYDYLTAGTEQALGGTKGASINGAAAAANGTDGVVIKVSLI